MTTGWIITIFGALGAAALATTLAPEHGVILSFLGGSIAGFIGGTYDAGGING